MGHPVYIIIVKQPQPAVFIFILYTVELRNNSIFFNTSRYCFKNVLLDIIWSLIKEEPVIVEGS